MATFILNDSLLGSIMKNKAIFIILFFSFMSATIQAEVVPIPNTNYHLKNSFEKNLVAFIGKRVQLVLTNGHEISGKIKKVENKLLHLEYLSGKDFFDALIRIKDISIIEAPFRHFQQKKRRPIKVKVDTKKIVDTPKEKKATIAP